ncbi:MAG TPA: 6-phosphogluconolactonase [Candidatus Saccharimonadales bacterium]|nr:6-phosphogluconolactonase [Candidatus Saccharimonadales bacterium]
MIFKKITSIEPVAAHIAGLLVHSLNLDNRTLWLVPGGSSIAVTAAVCKLLEGEDLHNLYVTLTDERYGPVGHKDSNWQQMVDAGLTLPGARLVPVIGGQDRLTTTNTFNQTMQALLDGVEYRIGFFGVGADGHTAGILPGSPAVTAETLVTSYRGNDFERITITPKAIARLDAAVVYGVGHDKAPVFDSLESSRPLDEQPAQALKMVADLTIFNDCKGEEAI